MRQVEGPVEGLFYFSCPFTSLKGILPSVDLLVIFL